MVDAPTTRKIMMISTFVIVLGGRSNGETHAQSQANDINGLPEPPTLSASAETSPAEPITIMNNVVTMEEPNMNNVVTMMEKPNMNNVVTMEEPNKGKLQKIYYINLESSTDRKEHIESELKQKIPNIPFERVPGVALKNLLESDDLQLLAPSGCGYTVDLNDRDSYGHQKGCCSDLAHRRAYKRIAEQNGDRDNDFYLVIEDDVTISKDLETSFYQAVKEAPNDWSMLRLGSESWGVENGPNVNRFLDEDEVKGTSWIRSNRHQKERVSDQEQFYMGAHAIVLTPARASAMLDRIRPDKLLWADTYTGNNPPNHNVYHLKKPLIEMGYPGYQGSVRADQDTAENAMALNVFDHAPAS